MPVVASSSSTANHGATTNNNATTASKVHANPNNATAMSGSVRLHHSVNGTGGGAHQADAQVQVIAHDQPLPTLCDLVSETLLDGRDPVRPTISRLVLVGELPNKDDPPRVLFDDCVHTTVKRVTAADPTEGKGSSIADPMNIAGLFVEYSGHFVQLLESEPAYLLAYAQELHARAVQKKIDSVSKLHVIFYVDDIVTRSCNKMFHVELPPSASSSGQAPEDLRLEDAIVEQTHKLLQLLHMAHNQTKQPVDNFILNAKSQQTALFPKVWMIDKCIQSGWCLTLDEYIHVFSDTPNVIRANEVLHPVEQPLPYAL